MWLLNSIFLSQICLQQIYEEAKRGFEDTNTKEKGVVLTKDDKAHGSLLIMNELIRSASIEGEVCGLCHNSPLHTVTVFRNI